MTRHETFYSSGQRSSAGGGAGGVCRLDLFPSQVLSTSLDGDSSPPLPPISHNRSSYYRFEQQQHQQQVSSSTNTSSFSARSVTTQSMLMSTFSTEVEIMPDVEEEEDYHQYGRIHNYHQQRQQQHHPYDYDQSADYNTSSSSTHSFLYPNHHHHNGRHSPTVDKQLKLSPSCRISSARITRVNSISKVAAESPKQTRRQQQQLQNNQQQNQQQRGSPRRNSLHRREMHRHSAKQQSLQLQTQRESPSSVRRNGGDGRGFGHPRPANGPPLFSPALERQQQTEPHLAPRWSTEERPSRGGQQVKSTTTINSPRATDGADSRRPTAAVTAREYSPRALIEDGAHDRHHRGGGSSRRTSSNPRRPPPPYLLSTGSVAEGSAGPGNGGVGVSALSPSFTTTTTTKACPPANLIVSYELTSSCSSTTTTDSSQSLLTSDLSPDSDSEDEDDDEDDFGSVTATCGGRGPTSSSSFLDYGLFVTTTAFVVVDVAYLSSHSLCLLSIGRESQ